MTGLKKWLINKKEEYEENALNSISDSRAINYMARATAIKDVLKHIEEVDENVCNSEKKKKE